MVEESVKRSVSKYLADVRNAGIDVDFGVVFGSQATGRAGQWSDIDLLVVSSRFDTRQDRRDLSLLWRLTIKTDSRIEPFAAGKKEWESDDSRAIIELARREGTVIN